MKRLIFYVQHLLGIGHLRRAALIAEACQRHGFQVTLIQGGVGHGSFYPTGVDIFQLPALKIGSEGFSDLRDANDNPVDALWLEHRKNLLIERVQLTNPDVLLIESFPFGRRQMRFELRPLLESVQQIKSRPLTVCSTRDILQEQTKSERIEETIAILQNFFDGILVHGDARLFTLDKCFPAASRISEKLRYTGIVAPPPPNEFQNSAGNRVVISAGGGAVGEQLMKTALNVRHNTVLSDHTWHFLTGPSLSESTFDELQSERSENTVIERFRSDFLSLLSTACLSISQCGYNTSADLLTTNTRAIVVPFSQNGETEQTMRAEYLRSKQRVFMLTEKDLAPESLIAAIDQALALPPPSHLSIDLNGAENTARLLDSWK